MNRERWIVIPNWEKFQHYKNRHPVWIKLYTDLNSNPKWTALTMAERGVLVTIWCEYTRSRGQVSDRWIAKMSGGRSISAHLESLNRAGFIEFRASTEKRREEKKELALANGGFAPDQTMLEIARAWSDEQRKA